MNNIQAAQELVGIGSILAGDYKDFFNEDPPAEQTADERMEEARNDVETIVDSAIQQHRKGHLSHIGLVRAFERALGIVKLAEQKTHG